MPLQIYNTLSRSKEEFKPLNPGRVGMYVCGPTVYSDAHVGHAKSYVTFDVVRRYLQFLGYHVTYVQNITDVGHLTDDADEGEDKMLKRSSEIKQHPMQIAATYTRRFFEDMAALNVLPPDISPLATGHILEQLEIIKDLIAKGYAYEINGSVYFDVTKDKDYGKLSGRKTEDQEASGRVQVRTEKRHPNDFALWKRAEKGHILRWPSPWGEGFPGWHIECSAMSMKYLGETFDIHGGGLENQFPHHECEIAQSESSTGKPFARYWMHNNLVTVDGKKMGKSIGNSSYLRDLMEQVGYNYQKRKGNEKKFSPMEIRFFLLQSHYRNTTEFKREAIQAAGKGFEEKILKTYLTLFQFLNDPKKRSLTPNEMEHPYVLAFKEAMDDDFNAPKAIALIYKIAEDTRLALSQKNQSNETLESIFQIFQTLAGSVLGIIPNEENLLVQIILDGIENRTNTLKSAFGELKNIESAIVETASIAKKADQALDKGIVGMKVLEICIALLIDLRKDARESKDFKTSDKIRDGLEKANILLQDAKDGTKWSLK